MKLAVSSPICLSTLQTATISLSLYGTHLLPSLTGTAEILSSYSVKLNIQVLQAMCSLVPQVKCSSIWFDKLKDNLSSPYHCPHTTTTLIPTAEAGTR